MKPSNQNQSTGYANRRKDQYSPLLGVLARQKSR